MVQIRKVTMSVYRSQRNSPEIGNKQIWKESYLLDNLNETT